jgi:hypothetical protein
MFHAAFISPLAPVSADRSFSRFSPYADAARHASTPIFAAEDDLIFAFRRCLDVSADITIFIVFCAIFHFFADISMYYFRFSFSSIIDYPPPAGSADAAAATAEPSISRRRAFIFRLRRDAAITRRRFHAALSPTMPPLQIRQRFLPSAAISAADTPPLPPLSRRQLMFFSRRYFS